MKKTSVNLTEGNIGKQLMVVALPILLSNYIQTLYNSADSIILGRMVGTQALAAVTASDDISNLIINFFVGLSTGAGVLFSRYFGAAKHKELSKAIHVSLLASMLLGLVMSVIGFVLAPFFLGVVNCPEDVFADALLYIRVYMVGIFFTSMYNVLSGVLRAVGDTKTPTKVLIITSLINVGLNIFSVAVLHMGVLGVALATIIAQGTSVVIVMRRMLLTDDVYRLQLRELTMDWGILKEIFRLGMPAAIQSCIICLCNLLVLRYRNSFGSAAMAGSAAGGKLDKALALTSQALGLSMTTFVAQNLGAKKTDRVKKGVRIGWITNMAAVVLLGIPMYIFAPQLVGLFTKDQEAISYGVIMMRLMVPLYFLQGTQQVFCNAVRGAGYSLAPMLMSLGGMVLVRQIALHLLMQHNYTYANVYRAFPIGWAAAAVANVLFFFLVAIPKMRQIEAEEA